MTGQVAHAAGPPLIVCRRIVCFHLSKSDVASPKQVQLAFGRAVRKHRIAAGMSQEQLAYRADIHRTYVGDVERGERNIGLVNVERLASALGVKTSVLMKTMEGLLS
jgi:ribosome-binding protein aMBF1 (putative translation factor)